jgi:hypothetical protein
MSVSGAAMDRGFRYRYDHFAGRVHMARTRAPLVRAGYVASTARKKDVSASLCSVRLELKFGAPCGVDEFA